MLVILDAGHGLEPGGDFDPGARNANRMVCEHDLAMFTCGVVYFHLEREGIQAQIVTGPSLLNDRSRAYGKYFISIHFNAYDTKTQGTEVLVANLARPDEVELATKLSHRLAHVNGLRDRGIKRRSLGVLRARHRKTTGVLVEPFFMDGLSAVDCYAMACRAGVAIAQTIIVETRGSRV